MAKGARTKFYVDLMAIHPEVTGSSILGIVRYPNGLTERFLIDCGLFQEKHYEKYNHTFPWNPESINAALLTHIHVDHVGRYPLLVKNGYSGKIHMTQDSKTLLPLVLTDSAKVLNEATKRTIEKPLYSQSDVEKTLKRCEGCEFEKTVQITPSIKATFFMNGHLIGSSIILLQIHCSPENSDGRNYEDINLLFTGDYNNKNIFFDVKELPDWVKELPLTVITEATYGDMDSSEIVECFEENILDEHISTRVVPVFSLGRAQEILYKLKCMQDEKRFSIDLPIYFDGKLSFKYTERYLDGRVRINEEMRNFLPKNLIYVSRETRPFVLSDRNPKFIVTTSGMGSHGPAQLYIPEYLRRKDSLIHFTGYTAEGTLGRVIKDAQQGQIVQVSGLMVPKNARVEYTAEYSGHAKRDVLIAFLKTLNIRFVLVNHGQEQVTVKYSESVLNEVDKKVGRLTRDYLFRVDAYGFVKSMTTKFN